MGGADDELDNNEGKDVVIIWVKKLTDDHAGDIGAEEDDSQQKNTENIL